MKKLLNGISHFRPSQKLLVFGFVIAAAVLLLPSPAAALFGLGDIVFDPTSYATLGKIMRMASRRINKR